jgi:hypothetical protein
MKPKLSRAAASLQAFCASRARVAAEPQVASKSGANEICAACVTVVQ